jgi:hypothetical protein
MIPVQWAVQFQQWKWVVIEHTGLAKDALHIYAGLVVFVTVRLLWRWRFGWAAAWCAALIITLGAEYLDILSDRPSARIRPDGAHWHDIWNTMFWPTVLAALGRWLVPAPRETAASQAADIGEPALANALADECA